jgi:hypothetical protein
MPLTSSLALTGLAIGGSVAGGIAANSQMNAAQAARQAALQQYLDINVPDPAQQQIILQNYQMTGQLDPAIETAINEGQTAQNSISLDPSTRAAQMSALSNLSNITANQGMDAQEKNQIQQGINQVNANEQGQTGAILQDSAARGVGGSGASLAAQLQAAQSGANNASQNALGAQSLASQRALAALSQQGALAGQIHSQDYNQALNAANAQDAIAQFNARNQNAAMATNTQNQNQAQAYNVQEGQNIANQNTGLNNYQQQYNRGLQQQQFQNQLGLASGKANAENGVANQANYQAQNTANMWSGISGALGTAAGAQFKYGNNTGGNYGSTNQDVSNMTSDQNLDQYGNLNMPTYG